MNFEFARRPAAFLAVVFATGILIANWLEIPGEFLWPVFFVLLILTFFLRKKTGFLFSLAILILWAGIINFTLWGQRSLSHPLQSFFPFSASAVSGCVVEPPKTGSRRFIAEINEVRIDHKTYRFNRRVLVSLLNPVHGLCPGDSVFLEDVTLQHLSPPRNPGQFDYRKYLMMHGVMAEVSATPLSGFVGLPQHNIFNVKRQAFLLRENFSKKIKMVLPENEANFLIAILLGKKEEIQPQVRADFQNTGIAHVLAISGLHVGFVVLIIFLLVSFLPLSFRWHNLLTILFLIFYVLLTGSKPPVVRAFLMVSIFLIGQNLEKKQDHFNTVFLAVFVILFFQPQQLFWVSFQFSFLAVLSILYFYQQLKPLEDRLMEKFADHRSAGWLKEIVITPFLISMAAQLGTIPLMAIYFHKIPLVSFLLNLIVIPMVGLIVGLGFMVLLASVFSLPFLPLLGNLLWLLIRMLIRMVHFAAILSFAYIQIPKLSLLTVVIYFLILFLVFTAKKEEYRTFRLPAFVLTLVLIFWVIVPVKHDPELLMLDVGQGESSLLRTSDDWVVLFDSGPVTDYSNSGTDIILPALLNWGHTKIDRVFISHPHEDHIGGLFSLLKMIKIDSVYLPDLHFAVFLQDSLKEELSRKKIGLRFLKMGDYIKIGSRTSIYILSPPEEFLQAADAEDSDPQINNTSLVSLVKIQDQAILITGDAEKPAEDQMLRWQGLLHANILKVGHHGSETSTSIQFLSSVRPEIGLIPVGKNNRHGHPSPLVLKELKDFGVKYFRTDRDGAVWLKYRQQKWEGVDWR